MDLAGALSANSQQHGRRGKLPKNAAPVVCGLEGVPDARLARLLSGSPANYEDGRWRAGADTTTTAKSKKKGECPAVFGSGVRMSGVCVWFLL